MYCHTCRQDFLDQQQKQVSANLAGDPSHYIFDLQQLDRHVTHRFESLQKFKADKGFTDLILQDFHEIRRLHRDSIISQIVALARRLCTTIDERIDAAEVEVTEITTKAAQSEFLSVDDSRKVFRTIEMRKAELKELAERVVRTMGNLAGEIERKNSQKLFEAVQSENAMQVHREVAEEVQAEQEMNPGSQALEEGKEIKVEAEFVGIEDMPQIDLLKKIDDDDEIEIVEDQPMVRMQKLVESEKQQVREEMVSPREGKEMVRQFPKNLDDKEEEKVPINNQVDITMSENNDPSPVEMPVQEELILIDASGKNKVAEQQQVEEQKQIHWEIFNKNAIPHAQQQKVPVPKGKKVKILISLSAKFEDFDVEGNLVHTMAFPFVKNSFIVLSSNNHVTFYLTQHTKEMIFSKNFLFDNKSRPVKIFTTTVLHGNKPARRLFILGERDLISYELQYSTHDIRGAFKLIVPHKYAAQEEEVSSLADENEQGAAVSGRYLDIQDFQSQACLGGNIGGGIYFPIYILAEHGLLTVDDTSKKLVSKYSKPQSAVPFTSMQGKYYTPLKGEDLVRGMILFLADNQGGITVFQPSSGLELRKMTVFGGRTPSITHMSLVSDHKSGVYLVLARSYKRKIAILPLEDEDHQIQQSTFQSLSLSYFSFQDRVLSLSPSFFAPQIPVAGLKQLQKEYLTVVTQHTIEAVDFTYLTISQEPKLGFHREYVLNKKNTKLSTIDRVHVAHLCADNNKKNMIVMQESEGQGCMCLFMNVDWSGKVAAVEPVSDYESEQEEKPVAKKGKKKEEEEVNPFLKKVDKKGKAKQEDKAIAKKKR
ncbi:hypothetical protein FGO68_gene2874 [Halteria grandinella]|uniref:Uncharacterized protein n=1 Tax=Halteria grandinella TaxID=5974 RepID=A0A8J8SXG6_HALGN|nr:hypothetical protein FGO68_gene2874 [Halteria grandinella]